MKRKVLIILLCALSLLGYFTVWYQNQLQQAGEKRMAQYLLQEFEYRRQIEDNIKREFDVKNRTKEFVVQLERNKELAGFFEQKLLDYEREAAQGRAQYQSSLNQQMEESKQKLTGYEQFLSDYKAQLENDNAELTRQIAEYAGKLLTQEERIEALTAKIEGLEGQMGDYQARLKDSLSSREEYARKLESYQEKLSEYEQKLDEYKSEQNVRISQPQAAQ